MTRRCGDCQLCCKLLPVENLKPSGERCRFQKAGKGCGVYSHLIAVSPPCALWNCMWLVDPDPEAAKLPRPDRCHYVLDIVPDFVHIRHEDGTRDDIPVMQVWVDPAFPDAVNDPSLLRWIEHVADTRGQVTIIRWDNVRAFTIWAPSVSPDRQWHRVDGEMMPQDKAGLQFMLAQAEAARGEAAVDP
jgi:hypothetical protein